jgi:hypothetical protein
MPPGRLEAARRRQLKAEAGAVLARLRPDCTRAEAAKILCMTIDQVRHYELTAITKILRWARRQTAPLHKLQLLHKLHTDESPTPRHD